MHYGQRLYRLTSKKFCRFISSLVANEWTMTNKVLNWAKSIWTNKSVEPTFFLFALAQGFYLIVAKNLYIDKVTDTFWRYAVFLNTFFCLIGLHRQFELHPRNLWQYRIIWKWTDKSTTIRIRTTNLQQNLTSKYLLYLYFWVPSRK